MATFHLQIVTPDRMVFDGQAERIIVRTLRGDVCILARHIDYAAPLGIGEARVTDADGVTRVAACSGGMIGDGAGEVRVTATTFEWPTTSTWSAPSARRRKRWSAWRPSSTRTVISPSPEAKLKRALARIHAKE